MGDGVKLNFDHFLQLMRRFQDETHLHKVELERKAAETFEFSGEEVVQFSEIFASADKEKRGELGEKQVRELLLNALRLVLQPGEGEQLQKMMKDIAILVGRPQQTLDFPGFLYLMKKMMDENLGNINSLTEEKKKRLEIQAIEKRKSLMQRMTVHT